MRNMFFTKRGIFIGGSFGFHGDNIYEQQALGAKLVLWTSNAGINPVGVVLTHSIEDTTSSAAISYGGASGATLTGQIYYEGNTNAGAVSGNGSVSVLGKSVIGFLQNSLLSNLSDNVSVEDGVVSTNAPVFNVVQNRYSISERVGPTNQFFVGAVPPAKPTCTAVAGGTAPNATYTVSVVPVFRTGENKTGQGMMSPPCDGATINAGVRPGVQTIQISWKAVTGAIGYDLYAGNTHNGISCASPLVPGGGSGIVSYKWTRGITGGCTGQTQTEDGSGPSNMTTSGIAANNLRMSNNLTATITPGVMSANRTQTLPDASGTFVLDTTIASLIRATAQQGFDNSNRANGATAVTQNIASGTATLGTGAIASATCARVVTVAGTGIATTDTLTWSFSADPSATPGYAPAAGGSLYILAYPTANNANFKVCNSTASSITPGAASLNWKVVR
jgi:hypothetical protein